MTRPPGGVPPRPPGKPPARAVPIYVERQSYRRRRLVDAACALPLLGWILWWLPLLWHQAQTPVPASQVLIYIFGIWFGLALVAARLVRLLDRSHATGLDPETGPDFGPDTGSDTGSASGPVSGPSSGPRTGSGGGVT
ncbi:hypothetical protein KUV73_18565 [Mameliella alba]|nr:hypothetical protein [Mameliella alba]MBY6171158.1 hypothetical protein [Mameliella alba]MBY6176382.1 hypothetical protein [Mameliella alba]